MNVLIFEIQSFYLTNVVLSSNKKFKISACADRTIKGYNEFGKKD